MDANDMRNVGNARDEVLDTSALTVGQLREALEGMADDAQVWVDVNHNIVRQPIDEFWHSTAKVVAINTAGDSFVSLYVTNISDGEDAIVGGPLKGGAYRVTE